MVVLAYQNRDGVRALYNSVVEASCESQACSVAILVAHEVDAMASCRILTTLLKRDNITYSIRPVANYSQILRCLEEIVQSDIKTVFLLNCGAVYNLPKALNGADVQCVVLDNHRPFHLANVHRPNVIVLDNEDSMDKEKEYIVSDGEDLNTSTESSGEDDDDDLQDSEDDEFDDYEDESEVENGDENSEAGSTFEENMDGDQEADVDEEEEGDGADADVDDAVNNSENEDNNDDTEEQDTSREDNENGAEEGFEADEAGDIFGDEEDEENVKVVGKKRKALQKQYDPQQIRRRALRRYYDRNAFYAAPTSALIVNLIKIRGISVSPDLMWHAILGTTDQFLRSNIDEGLYDSICFAVKSEVSQLQGENKYKITNADGTETIVQGSENGRVEDTMDYRFFLYRHWSLYESMYFSPYVASKLSTWKSQGGAKLQEMLAKIGLPLQECKQSYQFMNPQYRQKFRNLTEDGTIADEYDLKNPGILFHSFSRYASFKNPIAASDIVYSATALLEMCMHDVGENDSEDADAILESQMRSFNKAYDALGIRNEELVKEGIQAAIGIQRAVVKQAALMLERPDAIIKVKRFRYAYIYRTTGNSSSLGSGEDCIESPFARPMVLTRLAQFLMRINMENRKWINRNALPLVLLSERKHSFIVVGLSAIPAAVSMPKLDGTEVNIPLENRIVNFGQLFRLAAKDIQAHFRSDSFDSCIVEVGRDDVHSFIESLFVSMDY